MKTSPDFYVPGFDSPFGTSCKIIFPAGDQLRARKVVRRSNYGHVIKFASAKCGRTVELESLLEYDRAIQHEFDPSVIIFAEQPFRIEISIAGTIRNQYPDFLVFKDDGSVVVEEIKPSAKLSNPDLVAKLALQQQFFESMGYLFKVVTDECIRSGHTLSNSKRLLPYRRIVVSSVVREYVMRSLEDGPKTGRAIVSEGFCATEEALLALLAQGALVSNLSRPLGLDSVFQVNVRRSILTEKQYLALKSTCP